MAQTTQTSLGYPNIEKLIDSEDFKDINQSFSKVYQELESLSKSKGGLKKAKEAKKAMKALENVSELLKELLKVKYRLQEHIAKQKKSG